MDLFAQKKLLVRIVIILVVLNLFSTSVFLWKDIFHRPPPPRHASDEFRDVSDILQKDLYLTQKQKDHIQKLRSYYFEKENLIANNIRGERDSMNSAMFNKETDKGLVKLLAKKVADNEYKMEMLRFEQSQELKAICTPEQLEKFNKLVLEIRDYFRPDNQPKKRKKD